jgi:nucleotide-binding universal stress UspA family protein
MTVRSSDRIVVGVDGSAVSDAALRWGAREAALHEVGLSILYVVDPGVPAWGLGLAAAALPAEYVQLQRDDALGILERALQTVVDTVGEAVAVNGEVVYANPLPTLIDLTKDARMIVVGCRGRAAWQRGLFGSVSTGLVHHAHCPVAVIHAQADESAFRRGPVVVGVDGSPASELATEMAFEEARLRGTSLLALHAWSDADVPVVPVAAWPDFRPTAEETLANRLAKWNDRYPDVVVERRVVFDRPALHLVAAAEAAQLVVVGSHGRGGFAGMVLGSVSTAVVHAVHTPVVVARRSE